MGLEILVTNDDGIRARGLRALTATLSQVGTVRVVAPDRERSGTAHAITVHHPLRVDEVRGMEGATTAYQVDGTPADCVKLGVEALLPVRPDLVVSGVNRGPNLGTDVLYSGTVSAAVEGLIMGIPSVAVSVAGYDNWTGLDAATVLARHLALLIAEKGLPEDTLLNVNIPDCRPEEIRGIKITRVGIRRYRDFIDKRVDPWGRTYYWLAGEAIDLDNDPDLDTIALRDRWISITPVQFQLTHVDFMGELSRWPLVWK